jgi:imidazolonepropionase-like amidohydrolase
MKNLYIIIVVLSLTTNLIAQKKPADKQSKSVLIMNGTAHLGNGKVIENSLIAFKEGKLQFVADATLIRIDMNTYDIKIDAAGRHIYPGFIAPNSTLGLVEIDAVKASDDEDEIGNFNPNVKSLMAYNSESRVTETVITNGILTAQITPRGGRISGSSSIVQLDAWTWKDAVLKENDGIHLNFPNTFRTGRGAENGVIEVNKDYIKQIEEIVNFINTAKSYSSTTPKEKNLVLEAMKGLLDGTQTLFIHANDEKQIIDAVNVFKENGINKLVIVGGFEAYKTTELLLKHNIPVLLRRVHDMPVNDDQDYDLPFKMAKILTDKGILVGLENSGEMERMNTRNLPFLAGTCAAYGLDKEIALQLITSNTAKILGIDSFCGTLEEGKDATLFISEGDALDMRTNKLKETFIQGRIINFENHQSNLNKIYKSKYNQN